LQDASETLARQPRLEVLDVQAGLSSAR